MPNYSPGFSLVVFSYLQLNLLGFEEPKLFASFLSNDIDISYARQILRTLGALAHLILTIMLSTIISNILQRE